MRCVLAVFLLLLLLTGCAENTIPAQELEPAHTHSEETPEAEAPEASETQEAPVTPEALEVPEEPDYGDAAFCGGITLFAGDTLALVNSEEVTMEGAPFFEDGEFYVPLRFAAETLGWHYAEDGETITLSATKTWEWSPSFAPCGGFSFHPRDPVTQELCLTVGERVFTLNSETLESCSAGVPARRDGVVFLPLDFLTFSDGEGQQSVPWLFGGSAYDPETGYAILNGQRNEAGFHGFTIWQNWDELQSEQREGFAETGMLGQSSIGEYNVVEYTRGGLSVHVLRPGRDDIQYPDSFDGWIVGVYTSDPEIATPRGLRPGDPLEKAEQIYDGSFADSLSLRLDEDDSIVELGLHSPYYDIPPAGCHTLSEQQMFRYWTAHPEDAPDNWDPVTKDLDD